MTTHPWMKFYPADWRADPLLRNVSIAARGLWIEMLCLMHEASPRGHLVVNSKPMSDAQLSVQAGIPQTQLPDLLGELEEHGVFSRTRTQVIYSRRMVADEKKARNARENGKKGGNPTLGKDRDNPASDNLPLKAGDKLRSQKPDTRDRDNTSQQHSTTSDGAGLLLGIMKVAGWTSWPPDADLVSAWIKQGADPERHIMPVVTRIAEREIAAGRRVPLKARYFDAAVREEMQAKADAEDADEQYFERVRQRYAAMGAG